MNYFLRNLLGALALLSFSAWSSDLQCVVGPRIEKTWNLYWENGAEFTCSHPSLLWNHLGLGGSVTSTRVGSAFESNAVQQEQYFLSASWIFRLQKRVEPYVALNAGWFWLDVEDPIFNFLPHSAPLFALGGGTAVQVYGPVWCRFGIAYHLITGDGNSGIGSLYPLLLHTSVLWKFGA